MNIHPMISYSAPRPAMASFVRTKFTASLALTALGLLSFVGSAQAEDNTGTGGTITYTDSNGLNPVASPPYIGGYVVHKFTESGTLVVPTAATAEVLVVGGGGGGGLFGGGGGAGGLIYNNAFSVIGGNNYTVTIGAGGAGDTNGGGTGGQGLNTVFDTLTAIGGGGGGSRNGVAAVNGAAGGSGGGGSPADAGSGPLSLGGAGTSGQGSAGGSENSYGWGGSGGGGAAAAGGNATGNNAGSGGNGLAYSISGTSDYYAGGGGGGTFFGGNGNPGSGGLGGGGAGGKNASGGNGTPNTGSGGGGGDLNTGQIGGSGGSGVVIVKYPYDAGGLAITVTAPTQNQAILLGSPVTATATVVNGTGPFTVTFYRQTNGGGFTQVGSPDTESPYEVSLGSLPSATYQIYATVTDSAAANATSATTTFVVYQEGNTGTGGTILYTDANGLNPRALPPYNNGFVVHKFTASGTLNIPVPVTANVLVVAGGGGGGQNGGGGGGAGGLTYENAYSIAAGSTAVTVGAGGAGHPNTPTNPTNGENSLFDTITALGGGGGSSRDNGGQGASGGSGGGGAGATNQTRTFAGSGTSGQGFSGGNGVWPDQGVNSTGGGGGGAGGSGTAGGSQLAGNGGVGLFYPIFADIAGSPTGWFAGGGAGQKVVSGSNGTAGQGGGGAAGSAGVANTGGGGGGGGGGGSGIVLVRYPYDSGSYSITLNSPADGQSLSSTAAVNATATVLNGASLCTVRFYLDSNLVSTTTDVANSVNVNLGVLPLGSHTLYATATDNTDTIVSSATHTFTIATDTTAPTPNPMTFALSPRPLNPNTVVMTATTATDAWSPAVEYFFENTTNNANSTWISSTEWTDTGLSPVTVYSYRVRARDAVGNMTDWSEVTNILTPGWSTTNLYWDGGTTNIAGNGDGASQGGSGTWDTTLQNWDLGSDYPHVIWYNPNNDTAVFGGSAGTVTLSSDITVGGLTFTSPYTLAGGTVTFGVAGTIANSTNVTIASVIAGTMPITKSGTGTLTMVGANTFSGDFIINQGAMDIVTAGTFGTGSNLIFSGSGLILPAYGTFPVLAKSIAVNPGATASFEMPNQFYGMTVTGPISDSGNLVATSSDNGRGSISWTSAANTNTGTLQIGNSNYGLPVTVNSWADSANPIRMYGTSARPASFTLGGGTATPILFNSRQIELPGGTTNSVINNNNASAENTITINTDLLVSAAGAKTLTLGGSNTGSNTFAGKIVDGVGAVVSLVKANGGTWILAGANTHTGLTSVNAGKLLVNGDSSATTGGINVTSSGSLGGTGTFGGNATVSGNLAFHLSTVAASHNKLDIVGDLTFSGSPTLTITASGGASTGTYTLVTVTGAIVGPLPSVNLPAEWTANPLEVVGKNLVINITSTGPTSNYMTWATGGQTFTGDANGDGIADGIAWFLGADNPSINAQGKMPTPTKVGGFLNLNFERAFPYAPAKLYVQFGNNLTGWTELEIPDGSTTNLGGTGVQVEVIFGTTRDQVTVKIPTSYESTSGALYARLRATEN